MVILMNRENMVNHLVIIKARLCESCYFFPELWLTRCNEKGESHTQNMRMDVIHLQTHSSPRFPQPRVKVSFECEYPGGKVFVCVLNSFLLALITVNWSTLCNLTLFTAQAPFSSSGKQAHDVFS